VLFALARIGTIVTEVSIIKFKYTNLQLDGVMMDKERQVLYEEFGRLGIPVSVLHPLSNSALKDLLGSIKEAIVGYRESASISSSA